MKNQNPEHLNTQNTDAVTENSKFAAEPETNKAEPPTKPPGQGENEKDDIDYSSFDIDESTGGSAMEEFEEE